MIYPSREDFARASKVHISSSSPVANTENFLPMVNLGEADFASKLIPAAIFIGLAVWLAKGAN